MNKVYLQITSFLLTLSVSQTCLDNNNTCQVNVNCDNQNLKEISLQCEKKFLIKVLHYEDNFIKNIKPDAFENAPNLEKVILQRNRLESIHYEAFENLQNMKFLLLDKNNIKTITSVSFGRLKSLKKLELQGNMIENITSRAFADLPVLMSLNLKNNVITTIKHDAFALNSSVQDLYLGKNLISNVTFLNRLNNLKNLDCSNNNITDISKNTFENSSHLQVLLINYNLLEDLEFLQHLSNLKHLELSHNLIEEIRIDIFNKLKNLEVLSMGHNSLTSIGSGTFSELSKLKMLNLSFNKIVFIGEIFENLPNLKVFDLKENNLPNLSLPFGVNVTLHIDGNQWNCQFIKNISNRSTVLLKYSNITNVTNYRNIACRDNVEIIKMKKTMEPEIPIYVKPNIPEENIFYFSTTIAVTAGAAVLLGIICISGVIYINYTKRRQRCERNNVVYVSGGKTQNVMEENLYLYSNVSPYSVTKLF